VRKRSCGGRETGGAEMVERKWEMFSICTKGIAEDLKRICLPPRWFARLAWRLLELYRGERGRKGGKIPA